MTKEKAKHCTLHTSQCTLSQVASFNHFHTCRHSRSSCSSKASNFSLQTIMGSSDTSSSDFFCRRHVFLCYKNPAVWPPRIEAAEFDRLPRLLHAAINARKPHIKKEVCFCFALIIFFLGLVFLFRSFNLFLFKNAFFFKRQSEKGCSCLFSQWAMYQFLDLLLLRWVCCFLDSFFFFFFLPSTMNEWMSKCEWNEWSVIESNGTGWNQ